MEDTIERAKDRALAYLGASPEQVEKGLELHAKLFACDLFGFLPRTLSRKAYATLWEMIRNGASHDDIVPVRQVLGARGTTPVCRSLTFGFRSGPESGRPRSKGTSSGTSSGAGGCRSGS